MNPVYQSGTTGVLHFNVLISTKIIRPAIRNGMP